MQQAASRAGGRRLLPAAYCLLLASQRSEYQHFRGQDDRLRIRAAGRYLQRLHSGHNRATAVARCFGRQDSDSRAPGGASHAASIVHTEAAAASIRRAAPKLGQESGRFPTGQTPLRKSLRRKRRSRRRRFAENAVGNIPFAAGVRRCYPADIHAIADCGQSSTFDRSGYSRTPSGSARCTRSTDPTAGPTWPACHLC